eukprot:CAMPEP_0201119918 /NCGR_PEP_ID=MMETSP0850-20130426/4008_1 /ASSEMBLY_ACC=CAM_ASM_000622 /TAXON_ID=183588 /ORGANISM="Pseudo-nitzschia fraudulenta, Strain WWA7" /LENGTH=486 /DNA_ID=CAMNT_0047385821 /DNA_START=73 /DNA_END=1533 /DNA_ORIENTATION=+
MKFSISNALFAALTLQQISLGEGKRQKKRLIERDDEAFWKTFVFQGIDSMVKPTETPTPAPTSETQESDVPSDAPSIIGLSDTPSDGPSLVALSNAPSDGPSLNFVPNVPTASPTSSCDSLETIICTVPEFSTLCALARTAGLADALNEDIFTIFAPTNGAFESLPAEVLDALGDVDVLRDALLYHTAPEIKILASDLVCNSNVMMANLAETITVCADSEIYQVGSGNSPEALPKIFAKDGGACNGVIHGINQVMLQSIQSTVDPIAPPIDPTPIPTTEGTIEPSKVPVDPTLSPIVSPIDPTPIPTTEATIEPSKVHVDPTLSPTISPETCQSIAEVFCILPEFEILCQLTKDADLFDTLSGGSFTIFAPINDAFESLPQNIANAIISDTDLLTNVLLSHALPIPTFAATLECGGEISMISGEETTTVCADSIIFQVGAGNAAGSIPSIVAPDGVACNGVIHAIDGVILPAVDAQTSGLRRRRKI